MLTISLSQPVGVGFSAIEDRDDIAVTLREGARDVYQFLVTLSHDVFPHFAHRPWHLTGESMGGHYVTGYAQYIAALEKENAELGIAPRINISSAVIVDGYIDQSRSSVGFYDFFCTDWAADGRHWPLMSDSACVVMAAGVPTCEVVGAHCRESYDRKVCESAIETCDETVGKYFYAGIRPGGWDPYDSRHRCEEPPLCSDFAHGAVWKFFNQPWVQERLGFNNIEFELIDFDTNYRWVQDGSINLPVTRELTWILDNTDIRVLFINGNNDIIINTPGQMRLLDELPWKKQALFRSLAYEDWFFGDGELRGADTDAPGVRKGGRWKGTERLQIFTVDEAGHFAPYFQPESVGAVVRTWFRGQ
ncbi:hypothetical protein DV737_g4278, partial [Chaetothyriales sp. CBS 132003]